MTQHTPYRSFWTSGRGPITPLLAVLLLLFMGGCGNPPQDNDTARDTLSDTEQDSLSDTPTDVLEDEVEVPINDVVFALKHPA